MTIYDVVIKPVITERSMEQSAEKKYTFIVHKNADKTQIKNAVQKIFDVKVEKVSVMNYQGKLKRVGKNMGRRPSYKKAIVKLTEDSNDIEVFSA